MSAGVVTRFENDLRADLESGRWDARHGSLRTLPEFDGSLRLVVGRDQPQSGLRVSANP